MTTDKIIKKIIKTFNYLDNKATEINHSHGKTVIVPCVDRAPSGKYNSLGFYNLVNKKYAIVFIRDYIARNVDYIPELDCMENIVNGALHINGQTN